MRVEEGIVEVLQDLRNIADYGEVATLLDEVEDWAAAFSALCGSRRLCLSLHLFSFTISFPEIVPSDARVRLPRCQPSRVVLTTSPASKDPHEYACNHRPSRSLQSSPIGRGRLLMFILHIKKLSVLILEAVHRKNDRGRLMSAAQVSLLEKRIIFTLLIWRHAVIHHLPLPSPRVLVGACVARRRRPISPCSIRRGSYCLGDCRTSGCATAGARSNCGRRAGDSTCCSLSWTNGAAIQLLANGC